jgi:hypothetical protein
VSPDAVYLARLYELAARGDAARSNGEPRYIVRHTVAKHDSAAQEGARQSTRTKRQHSAKAATDAVTQAAAEPDEIWEPLARRRRERRPESELARQHRS